jgi:hypothetical protein
MTFFLPALTTTLLGVGFVVGTLAVELVVLGSEELGRLGAVEAGLEGRAGERKTRGGAEEVAGSEHGGFWGVGWSGECCN